MHVRADFLAHRPDPLDVLSQRFLADPHLDGMKAAVHQLPVLFDQFGNGKVEIDAAGIGVHVRVMAAQQAPQGNAELAGLQVPQGDVDGRDGKTRRAAASGVVHVPPHALPQRLDEVGVAALQEGREFALDECDDALAAVQGVGIADAFHAILVPQAHDDELGVGHDAVHGILHGERQGKTIKGGFNVCDGQGGFLADSAAAWAARGVDGTCWARERSGIVEQSPGGRLALRALFGIGGMPLVGAVWHV